MSAVTQSLSPVRLRKKERTFSLFASLRFRLIVSVALVHVVLMGAFVWKAVNDQSATIRRQLLNRGNELVTLMVVASTNGLLSENLGSLGEVTERVKSQPGVVYADIVDIRHIILASSDIGMVGRTESRSLDVNDKFPLEAGSHILNVSRPIIVAGRRVGTVLLGLSTRNMAAALERTRNRGIVFILLALIIGSSAAWLLSMVVTRHLHALINAVRRIGEGDLSVRVKVNSRDEVGVLGRAFNAMVESLHRSSREIAEEHEKRTDAERLACVGELAASIAHEIRNPLAAVINAIPLLGGGKVSPEDRTEALAIVNTQSRRLQRILDDFLRFSRMREAQPVRGNIALLVEEVCQVLRHDPSVSSGTTVRHHVPDGECWALFDPDQMRQVLWNTMLNAVQAMPGGGTLDVIVRPIGDRVKVVVTDTGSGIPRDIIDKVMRPFFTRRNGGTGLGLAIVQRVLMQHGSKLLIESEPGQGTRAAFDLPAA